jgi:hypothetical protein
MSSGKNSEDRKSSFAAARLTRKNNLLPFLDATVSYPTTNMTKFYLSGFAQNSLRICSFRSSEKIPSYALIYFFFLC